MHLNLDANNHQIVALAALILVWLTDQERSSLKVDELDQPNPLV